MGEPAPASGQEKWPAIEISQIAGELGVDLAHIDLGSIADEGPSAPAYLGSAKRRTSELHLSLGVPKNQPIAQHVLVAAAGKSGVLGQRARLALKLLGMERSGSGR